MNISWNKKIRVYGGLFSTTMKRYGIMQAAVFACLITVFIASFFVDLDEVFLGNAKLFVLIIASLEVIEMVYVYWTYTRAKREEEKQTVVAGTNTWFEQIKFNKKLRFTLDEDELIFFSKLDATTSEVEIPYTQIMGRTWDFVEKNEWFRNAGYIWLAIGGLLEVTPLLMGTGFRFPLWTLVGVVCVGIYYFRQVAFTVIEGSGNHNILVIQDNDHDQIIETIYSKRNSYIMEKYGAIDYEVDPQEEIGRFKYFKKEKVIDELEFEKIKEKIEEYHRNKPIISPLSM